MGAKVKACNGFDLVRLAAVRIPVRPSLHGNRGKFLWMANSSFSPCTQGKVWEVMCEASGAVCSRLVLLPPMQWHVVLCFAIALLLPEPGRQVCSVKSMQLRDYRGCVCCLTCLRE